MKKIVIKSYQGKPDEFLTTLLNMLFPDCEIVTVLGGMETSEKSPESSTYTLDMANGKGNE